MSTSISDILSKADPQLVDLVSRVKTLQKLDAIFKTVLEPDLIPHTRIGYYEKGILILFTENASFATRLRFCVPTLLSKVRELPPWAGLCSIQVKVQPGWHRFNEQKPKEPLVASPLTLSAENGATIQLLADSLKKQEGMEQLVASLERLANHAARSSR